MAAQQGSTDGKSAWRQVTGPHCGDGMVYNQQRPSVRKAHLELLRELTFFPVLEADCPAEHKCVNNGRVSNIFVGMSC